MGIVTVRVLYLPVSVLLALWFQSHLRPVQSCESSRDSWLSALYQIWKPQLLLLVMKMIFHLLVLNKCSDSVGRSLEEQYLVSQASTRMMGAQWHLEKIGHQKWMNVSFWGAALLDKECKVSGADQAGVSRLQLLREELPYYKLSKSWHCQKSSFPHFCCQNVASRINQQFSGNRLFRVVFLIFHAQVLIGHTMSLQQFWILTL